MAKLNIKKVTAALCAAAVMSSMTACGQNTTWGAVINGEKVPAGIFISYLQSAYYEAQEKLGEQTADAPVVTDAEGNIVTTAAPSISESLIDGVSTKQWIYDKATKDMQIYMAIEEKFNEYGLTLSDEDMEVIDIYCEQYWDYYGEFFTEKGVSRDSFRKIQINNTKRDLLFGHVYSENGESPLSDDDMKAYLDSEYAMINFIDMELKDGEGNLLKSEGKAERMAMAEEYIERFNNGEDLDVMNAEYQAYYEKLIAAATETESDTDGLVETEVNESDAKADMPEEENTIPETEETEAEPVAETEAEVTEPAVSETEAETTEAAPVEDEAAAEDVPDTKSNKQAVKRDSTTPSAKVITAVFDEMAKGEAKIIESDDGEHYYIVAKLDILESDDYFNQVKESLIYEMKSDEFIELLTSWTEDQTLEKNMESYERYDPEKMFGAEE